MQPGINMTPAGRKQFIEVQKRLVTRRKEIADLASEYRKTNGTLNMGFYDELAKLREQRLFQDMESPAAPAATQAPAPAASPSGWRVLR
jgi:hypothetical protein